VGQAERGEPQTHRNEYGCQITRYAYLNPSAANRYRQSCEIGDNSPPQTAESLRRVFTEALETTNDGCRIEPGGGGVPQRQRSDAVGVDVLGAFLQLGEARQGIARLLVQRVVHRQQDGFVALRNQRIRRVVAHTHTTTRSFRRRGAGASTATWSPDFSASRRAASSRRPAGIPPNAIRSRCSSRVSLTGGRPSLRHWLDAVVRSRAKKGHRRSLTANVRRDQRQRHWRTD